MPVLLVEGALILLWRCSVGQRTVIMRTHDGGKQKTGGPKRKSYCEDSTGRVEEAKERELTDKRSPWRKQGECRHGRDLNHPGRWINTSLVRFQSHGTALP